MRPRPDLQGFADAQAALRDRFGIDVTFLVPVAASYAGPSDPESGSPYDPWETPVSGGTTQEVTKHVSVVNRPLGGVADASQATPIGRLASDEIALILPYGEWGDVDGATHVIYLDDRYKITEVRDDAMATVYRRKIIYATKS